MSLPSPKLPILHAMALGAICFVAITPFFWRGSPSGHDFEFHMFSWMEVVNQWTHGIFYPRWAALAHWGYGEARFLFYPPASWGLGAALGAFLPWKMVPGAYCWTVLTLAGLSMYRVAREWLPARDALFAAALYAVNPYHLVIVYWRSALAELLAAALLPLLVLYLLRISEPGFRVVLYLALTLAASWLTNAPAAVMIHYSAAGLALLLAIFQRSWRPVWRTAIAVALGAGLASFYLVPTIYETRWVSIEQVLAPGLRPQDNFLFTKLADPEHNQFNLLVSTVAAVEIGVLVLAIWMSRRWRSQRKNQWLILAAWGSAAALIMIPVTNQLWQHLPKLVFVQLPWRWLLCLNAALAVLLTVAIRRWSLRGLAVAVLLGAVLFAGCRIQAPWWDTSADIAEMNDAITDSTGYEGTDEYVPAGADPYELNKDQPRVMDSSGHAVRTETLAWQPSDKHLVVATASPDILTIRLFNYPAWQVTVNGQDTATATTEVTSLMMIPVAAGRNDIHIHFGRTRDRTIGGLMSLLALGIFDGLMDEDEAFARPQRVVTMALRVLIATSNPGKLRDFAGVAEAHRVAIDSIPNFSSLTPVVEDGTTFEANARKKADAYSLAVPGELVVADDSGLEVDELGGAPGIHSARYAADNPHLIDSNTKDHDNNARLLRELKGVPHEKRTARFVCVLAAARDGITIATFRGEAEGVILEVPRGENGFGYDPLFLFPQIDKTFAELSAAEKSIYSHRGAAFRKFLEWLQTAQTQTR